MERQPQNPEFRINPENFHPCILMFQIHFKLTSFSFVTNKRTLFNIKAAFQVLRF